MQFLPDDDPDFKISKRTDLMFLILSYILHCYILLYTATRHNRPQTAARIPFKLGAN